MDPRVALRAGGGACGRARQGAHSGHAVSHRAPTMLPQRCTLRTAVALALALPALMPACATRSKMPQAQPVDSNAPADAAAAERRGAWDRAAELWYSIFVGSGRTDAVACAGTARAMLQMGDPESASKLIDQGLTAK